MGKGKWWSKGVRFECQGSGKCCVSHGEYGFVFLTLNDRRRIAQYLGMSTNAFTKKFCVKDSSGSFHLIEEREDKSCMFLEKSRCSIYEARPTQCRTWPFWPEVMKPKTWAKEVATFCPGIGKGRLVTADEIVKQLASEE